MTELDPPVQRRPLPDAIQRAREQFLRVNRGNEAVLDGLSTQHLRAYRAALGELEAGHIYVADNTDLDLAAATRPAAIWLLAGRSVALNSAILTLLDAGHPNEVSALVRQLHESNRLLDAIALGSDDLAETWLRNKHVAPGAAARATRARHREIREDMLRNGVRPPEDIIPALNRAYGGMSEMAHNRYRHVLATVSVEGRMMPLGAHPDARVRAGVILEVGDFVMETVTIAGHGLANILGRAWLTERFKPTFRALQDFLARTPLTRELLNG